MCFRKQLPRKMSPIQLYKVVQIWPGRFVCKQITVCPGHIWTTLYDHKKLPKSESILAYNNKHFLA
jgi:hypothetical protein